MSLSPLGEASTPVGEASAGCIRYSSLDSQSRPNGWNLCLRAPCRRAVQRSFFAGSSVAKHVRGAMKAKTPLAACSGGLCTRFLSPLAQKQYTLADHFFHAAFDGSLPNHFWLVSACTPSRRTPAVPLRC